MYRIRRNYNQWRERWPWRWIFTPKVNERFCRHCGLPFQEGTMPEPIGKYQQGSIGVLVFPAGGFRQKEFVVRFGRWKASGGRFYLSEYVPTDELANLLTVAHKVQNELTQPQRTRAARR